MSTPRTRARGGAGVRSPIESATSGVVRRGGRSHDPTSKRGGSKPSMLVKLRAAVLEPARRGEITCVRAVKGNPHAFEVTDKEEFEILIQTSGVSTSLDSLKRLMREYDIRVPKAGRGERGRDSFLFVDHSKRFHWDRPDLDASIGPLIKDGATPPGGSGSPTAAKRPRVRDVEPAPAHELSRDIEEEEEAVGRHTRMRFDSEATEPLGPATFVLDDMVAARGDEAARTRAEGPDVFSGAVAAETRPVADDVATAAASDAAGFVFTTVPNSDAMRASAAAGAPGPAKLPVHGAAAAMAGGEGVPSAYALDADDLPADFDLGFLLELCPADAFCTTNVASFPENDWNDHQADVDAGFGPLAAVGLEPEAKPLAMGLGRM